MIPIFQPKFEELDCSCLPENEWRGTPPEKPGTYEFCCGELDYEVETVVVEIHNGELWCRLDGEFRPVQQWHDNLTCPAWRTPPQD